MKRWPEARGQRDSAVAMDGLMNTIRLVWSPAQRADMSHSSAMGTIHLRLLPSQLLRTLHGQIHPHNTYNNIFYFFIHYIKMCNEQKKKRNRFTPLIILSVTCIIIILHRDWNRGLWI